MTDHELKSLRDDLSYLKALAAEGRQGPLLGGAILAFAGVVFSLASVGHWAIVTDLVRAGPWGLTAMWVAAMMVFFAGFQVLKRRVRTKPGAFTPGNRAMGMVWGSAGIAAFVMWIAFMLYGWRTGAWSVMGLFPSVILALYGAGWAVAAVLSDRKWIRFVSIGAYAAAVGVALLIGRQEQYLAYAAALLALLTAPGLALLRQEPSDTV